MLDHKILLYTVKYFPIGHGDSKVQDSYTQRHMAQPPWPRALCLGTHVTQ